MTRSSFTRQAMRVRQERASLERRRATDRYLTGNRREAERSGKGLDRRRDGSQWVPPSNSEAPSRCDGQRCTTHNNDRYDDRYDDEDAGFKPAQLFV